MKKTLALLIAVLTCIGAMHAQKVSLSFNGNYRTKYKDFGIGTQVMIPVYNNFFIAPGVSYYFDKEYKLDYEMINSKTNNKSFNYGLDIHYAFFLKGTNSFVSPFIGVEGMVIWSKTTGSYLGVSSNSSGIGVPHREWSSFGSDDWHSFSDVVGNIGIAGKWFTNNNLFFNTQVRYSIDFDNMDYNFFVFTAGVGYAF
ncbi:outer membrane beta-barrel protein [Prevotella sp. 10(H)]|uniref:outer membrane beta-barrel protein n=1 Tax=Prevotella sp. 10(H) TaxID=1158294 RepID=UPI0004A6BAC6|nr:outer membrane beta-barrel protein [Prevotella sp. 10(H)]